MKHLISIVMGSLCLLVAVIPSFAQQKQIGTRPIPERPAIGNVAIDTVPLPESPRFRFEIFFLNQLRIAGAIDAQTDLDVRFRLNIEAIQVADSIGYFIDFIPEECRRANPPRWCWYIGDVMTGKPSPICLVCGGITTEARILLINSLISNKFLARESRATWQNLAHRTNFIEATPMLLKNIRTSNWSAQRALDILDHSFTAISGIAYPVPGGYWDKYCREHPEDPICWVIHTDLFSSRARNLAQELVLVSLLQAEKLLTVEQTRAIYDVTYNSLTSRRSIKDISLVSGVSITEALKLNPNQRNSILSSIATNRVGLVDPDSPWADICFRPNPPRICQFIRTYPFATTLTTQLIKNKIWTQNAALSAWNGLYKNLTGGGGLQPARIDNKK